MLAVVTGASGLLGGNLAIELIAQGHHVRATRRGNSRVAHLEDYPIDWVTADLGDEDLLARGFADAHAVFHCAAQVSIVRRVTPELRAANVDGTRRVIGAVRKARVKRLVHCSTVGAVGLSENGRPCDESTTWNFDTLGMADGYVTTKHQAEELVHRAVADGLDAVIVNPTYMLGPYDAKPSSGKLIINIVKGKVPGWTPGFNNFIDVRDVAKGMILACSRGVRGQRYILGGENRSYRDIFECIAKEAGVAPPTRPVPRIVATLLGWSGDAIEMLLRREPLINSVTVGYGFCTTFQFTSEKAKRELGYAPGPIEPAIRDALAWFRQRGMV